MKLKKILKKHDKWLRNKIGGKCANLKYADLRGAKLYGSNLMEADLERADLRGVNLREANLKYANLKYANLMHANLMHADLRGANLKGANLKYANLKGANLSGTDLRYADLSGADLSNANLSYADLNGADLWNSDLADANLKNIKTNTNTIGYHLACPEEGSFIGYKKANRYLIKLLIPENAKRSSATTLKCRCSEARVLNIEDIKTGLKVQAVNSSYNPEFIYRVGEIVTVDDFDENRWNECSTGIHFFMNRDNAINY